MIKNIIFDIGNVIAYYNMNEAIKMFAKNEEDEKFLYDNVYQSPEWIGSALIDSGFLSYEDIATIICDRTNHVKDELITNFLVNHLKGFRINQDIVDLIKKLKTNGYKVYILSNTNQRAIDYLSSLSNFISIADGHVFSFENHSLKPHVGIYNELINKYNLNPEESMFIDDVEENMKTANKLGIKGRFVLKDDYNSVISSLKEQGINID